MNTLNVHQPIRPVFNLLKLTFGIVPIVAGLDKFTNLLTDWEKYLNPNIANILPFSPRIFMLMVGVIEIIAGVLVLVKPLAGGYVVAAWLTVIAISLLAWGSYLDIAIRDLVMAISSFSMARISKIVG